MIGIVIITFTGLIIGIILNLLDNEDNSKKDEYLKRLPGVKCGSCGFGRCEGMAEAMCKNIENYKKCKPLRGEKLKEMEEYLKELN